MLGFSRNVCLASRMKRASGPEGETRDFLADGKRPKLDDDDEPPEVKLPFLCVPLCCWGTRE
jgi:hypothetical protein